MHRLTIGQKLLLSVVTLFVLFVACFVAFQQVREKKYKTETLSLRFQNYNNQLAEAIALTHRFSEDSLDSYVREHPVKGLRLTIINTAGKVVYDNVRKDYSHIASHANRKEFREALRTGSGTDVSRLSSTTKETYFYAASYYPSLGVVIRSALPYNDDLSRRLTTDQHYLWFAFVVTLLLILVLYRFVNVLGRNITNLRRFANEADKGGILNVEDLAKFPNDELGEISEHIVKLFMKIQNTRQEQNILKRQLTQNVEHELKTPVASIQGYLETILSNPSMSEEQKMSFLQRCYAQSQRLTSLLQDISILNRLDDAPIASSFETIDVTQVVRNIENEVALHLVEKGMKFVDKLPDHIKMEGSVSLVYSIFRNLTDNAIAYAGMGSTIIVEYRGGVFSFYDDGIGVPPEHLPRLFERFYRVDKGRSRKLGGTGLGLAIVKNAVLVHGGTISVRANNPHGLRFDFTF